MTPTDRIALLKTLGDIRRLLTTDVPVEKAFNDLLARLMADAGCSR